MRCGDDLHKHVGYAEHGSRGNSRCGSKDEAKGQRSGEPGGRVKPSAYVARVRAATVTMKASGPLLLRRGEGRGLWAPVDQRLEQQRCTPERREQLAPNGVRIRPIGLDAEF